ncbi:MAG: VOC family protein [Cyanobacteria bacterium P01_C01_bin.89]
MERDLSGSAVFHLAFPVLDMARAREFYGDRLGCEVGRESKSALILNLYGNQLVAHLAKEISPQRGVYPRHFGLVFETLTDWEALVERMRSQEIPFYDKPRRRFTGDWLEHYTVFIADPFDNLMEFKFYCNSEAVFGSRGDSRIGDRPLDNQY